MAPAELVTGVSLAPVVIRDLAEGCVAFVQRSLGVALDYTAETLPLLDHYLAQAREDANARPETVPLLVQSAGAYFGEVVRRRHPSFWCVDGDDASAYRIAFEQVYLSLRPAELMREALLGGEASMDASGATPGLELEEGDRRAVSQRLAELPDVSEAEYYAPSTRLEVIDIAVEATHARRMAEAGRALSLGSADYESDAS